MTGHFDVSTLNWVKGEIDETLKEARVALERFAENPEDGTQPHFCSTYLHQVAGTLQMVELYGAWHLATEMEHLADAIPKLTARETALEVLMHAILLLPDYLEVLQGGEHDTPLILLPLINELRRARGEAELTEADVFWPDLSVVAGVSVFANNGKELQTLARRVRPRYQTALLNLFKGRDEARSLKALAGIFDKLGGAARGADAARAFWAGAGFVEVLREQGLPLNGAAKLRLGKFEQFIRRIGAEGETRLDGEAVAALVRTTLFEIARSGSQGRYVTSLKEAFALHALSPSAETLEKIRSRLRGFNAELKRAVALDVLEELSRVKDVLDLFSRGGEHATAELAPVSEGLRHIADVLGLVRQAHLADRLRAQVTEIDRFLTSDENASESMLMGLAESVLSVESALSDWGSVALIEQGDAAHQPLASTELALEAEAEHRRVVRQVMKVAKDDLVRAREAINAFLQNPAEKSLLAETPEHLRGIIGSLSMLSYRRVARVVKACLRFVETDLAEAGALPSSVRLDALADAMMSVEYYLDAFVESRVHPASVLEVAERAVVALGYADAEDESAPAAAESAADIETAPAGEMQAARIENEREDTLAAESAEGVAGEDLVLAAPVPASDETLPVWSVDTGEDESALSELWGVAEQFSTQPGPLSGEPAPASESLSSLLSAFDEADEVVSGDLSALAPEPVAADPPGAMAADVASAATDGAETILVEAPAPQAAAKAVTPPAAAADLVANTGEADEEITAVFVEEAEGEFQRIAELFPAWRADPSDEETLRDLRRSFHTLKGSGRLVGARKLGEVAWAIENLLNRVLDRTVRPGTALFALLERAVPMLPELLAEYTGGPAPAGDVPGLIATAFGMGQGEIPTEVTVPASAVQAGIVIEDPVLREIYTKETETHLQNLRAYLDQCPGQRCRVTEGLLRALHTLRGSSRTAGVKPLAEMAGTLEQYARVAEVAGNPLEADGLAVLRDTAEWISALLAYLNDERADVPPYAELSTRVSALMQRPAVAAPVTVQPQAAEEQAEAVVEHPLETDEAALAELFELGADETAAAPGSETVEAITVDAPGEPFADADPWRVLDADFARVKTPESPLSLNEATPVPAPAADSPASWLGDFIADELDILAPGDAPFVIDTELAAPAESGLQAFDAVEEVDVPAKSDAAPQDLAPVEEISLSSVAADEQEPVSEEIGETLLQPLWAEAELLEDLLNETDAETETETETESPSELLAVFINEAGDLINSTDELIQKWVEHPHTRKPTEALQRTLHTLKGSARWAGVTPIVDLGHALESAVAAVVEGRATVDEELLHLAQHAQSHLEALLAQLRNSEELGSVDEICARLRAVAATAKPVSAPVASYDLDLLSIFLEEGHEILNITDDALQTLVSKPGDRATIENIQRQLHTLKGGARMAGVTEIGDLGHSLESMLAAVADGLIAVTPAMIGLMERSQDRLVVMLEQLRHHAPLPSGLDLIAEVEALTSGSGIVRTEAEEANETVADEPAAPVADGQREELFAAPVVEEHRKPALQAEKHDRRDAPRPSLELVRVRADLLDHLVNVAGEASIFRARIEQQVGGMGFNLHELEQVITRLREKLRLFDIETEAQIQSRYEEAAQQGYEDFDPLEFDRFTQMQQISRSMMESLADLSSIGSTLHGITRESETLLVQQARVNTELQEGLMHTRMVPLVQNAPRLRRVVRQACDELGRHAELRFKGAEVEMDRNVVERIMAPLEHLLRNAVAHGIEPPAVREAAGKPRAGIITVQQAREGSEVVVRVTDDGTGINVDAVREKAIARGLMSPHAQLSREEIMLFILESGFSTAESINQIAGRGVGMDVVNSEVKNLNGTLTIDSEPGQGTMFTIRLPLTLTVSRALLVQAGSDVYAIPLLSIEGIVRIAEQEVEKLLAAEHPMYRWLSNDYHMMHLATVLRSRSEAAPVGEGAEHRRQSILLAHTGEHRVALVVDGLIGSREIVVKPIGRQLGSLRALSGATILGDGSVALILELPALIRAGLAHTNMRASNEVPVVEAAHRPTVMVVDDSITVRKVTSRLLERNDMQSIAAKDGLEALTMLAETIPDMILLDIEMPRMDGYELASHVRNDLRLRHIPIIMITSRSGDKHRQRAMQIGVDIYMTKPFQENELLDNIRALLQRKHMAAGGE